jgi:hypothetical protein
MSKPKAPAPIVRPTIHFVDCMIDGENYPMAFSYNRLAEVEAATNLNMLAGGLHAFPNISATHYRALVWAAMTIKRPELTLDDVGNLMTPETMPVIQKALIDAYFKSTENPTGAAEKKNAAAN